MVDPVVTKPITASPAQASTDALTALVRLLIVVFSTAPAAALLVKKHDLIGLYDYFQSQQGVALLGAVSGLAALLYGLYKSYKRGAQIVTVASDPKVPSSVAKLQ